MFVMGRDPARTPAWAVVDVLVDAAELKAAV